MAEGLNDEGKRIGEHYDKSLSPQGHGASSLGDAERKATGGGQNDSGNSQESSADRTADDLSSAETNASGDDSGDDDSLYSGSDGNDDQGNAAKSGIANLLGKMPGGKKGKWALLFAGGGGAAILTVVIIVVLISVLAPYRSVHFATVLRSVGMARFQMYMKRTYAATVLDAALLTDKSPIGSTASDKLKGRTMRDRLFGVNIDKQLRQLGTEGALKFDFQDERRWGGLRSNITFSGVELYGQKIDLNDVSDKLWGKPYAELSRKERLTTDKSFTDAIKNGLNDQMALEGRGVRSSVFNGFRRVSGISMTKWADKARKYAGAKPAEARKLNLEESLKNVDGARVPPKSGIREIQNDADAVREDSIKAAQEGKTTTPGQTRSKWANRAKVTGNISEGVLLTTIACIVHDLNNSFKEGQKDTPDKAAAVGHDALTGGSQVQSGETQLEAVGGESDLWKDAEQSVYYKKAVGQPVSNEEMTTQVPQVPDIRGPSGALVNTVGYADELLKAAFGGALVGAIPGLSDLRDKGIDEGCSILLNQYVQFGIAGAEITFAVASAGATKGITAGIKAFFAGTLQLAAGVGVGHILGSMIDRATSSYAGMDFSAATTGPQKYNNASVGVDYLTQVGDRQIAYGRLMTDAEARQSQAVAMDELRQENSEKSFTERYFALNNPYSLASQTLIKMPSSMGELGTSIRSTLASTASILLSPTKLINSLSGTLASSNRLVFAEGIGAVGSGHGVDEWGHTPQEEERFATEEDFTWENLAAYVEPQWDELEKDYRDCYTFEKQIDRPEKCTVAFLSTDRALKWQRYNALSDAAVVLSGDVNKGDE